MLRIATVTLVVEPLLRGLVYALGWHWWELFYLLTPFRLDGLAMGALLSVLLSQPRSAAMLRRSAPALLATVLVAVVVCGRVLHLSRMNNPLFYNLFGYPLLAAMSGLLLAVLVTSSAGWLASLFSASPLRVMGSLSYGFYLYHLLVINVVNRWLSHFAISRHRSLITFPVSLLISWMSFRFLEKPIIRAASRRVRSMRQEEMTVTEMQRSIA